MPSAIEPRNGGRVTPKPKTAMSMMAGIAYVVNLSVTKVRAIAATAAATC